ncbi:MAG TPA: type II secretion system F family protein [Candidatus Avacidaminococcus intestinavium]|uniref:Type II secretion system F family protein n=1 Tax=Candidatus Avacidaminococcus intestinavium TaxID=2840684 RepID=A0A9D1SLE0_9FIRM|nr:type II secretion system F family protein [Candidatus Avacidaminococcus intestinavium]
MAVYQWQARDKKGKKYNGELWAENERDVASFVRANFGYVIGIHECKNYFEQIKAWLPMKEKQNNVALENFFKELSILLNSGITLLRALEMFNSKTDGSLKQSSKKLIDELKSGKSLAEAMSKQTKIFPVATVKVVDAGENSGSLSVLMSALANYYAQQNNLYRFLKNICIYPTLLVCFMLSTLIFFVIKVLPMFSELYMSLGIEVPTLLAHISFIANLVDDNPVKTSCLFLFFCGTVFLQRKRIKEYCLFLPGINLCYKRAMEERYCRMLSIMLTSGIPIMQAFRAAGEALQSKRMQEKSLLTCLAISRGASVTKAMSLHGNLLSDSTMEMISIGEDSGQLAELLEKAAVVADAKLQNDLKKAKAAFEPVLLVFLAVLIGGLLYLVISPVTGLIAELPEYI